ncbi:MAG: hypothetical protein ACLRSW_04390 [Christensenellaceae bacterium]
MRHDFFFVVMSVYYAMKDAAMPQRRCSASRRGSFRRFSLRPSSSFVKGKLRVAERTLILVSYLLGLPAVIAAWRLRRYHGPIPDGRMKTCATPRPILLHH